MSFLSVLQLLQFCELITERRGVINEVSNKSYVLNIPIFDQSMLIRFNSLLHSTLNEDLNLSTLSEISSGLLCRNFKILLRACVCVCYYFIHSALIFW
jgi:hypothetical protein